VSWSYRGVLTALITPFHEDGAVDYDAFESLTERQLAHGIHGLVACGTTGETPTLSQDEWEALIRIAVGIGHGRVPVIAGVGTNDTGSTIDNIERAAAAGVDAGLLVFPYYNKPNPNGLRQHVEAALDVGLPLMLYHVPGRTGHRLSADLLTELCAADGVIGLKEATGDVRLGGDVLSGTSIPVLSGDDFTFLGLTSMGGAGVVSVVSNVAPAHTLAVWERHQAGDTSGAAMAMQQLWPLITFLFDEVNPVPCKAALETMGLCRRHTRLPLAPYDGPTPAPILADLGLLG
jgi:4-hydroxy-tetrahydrodipicolinate synthase